MGRKSKSDQRYLKIKALVYQHVCKNTRELVCSYIGTCCYCNDGTNISFHSACFQHSIDCLYYVGHGDDGNGYYDSYGKRTRTRTYSSLIPQPY